MIYSSNFTMRGAIALEAKTPEEARTQAKEVLSSLGGEDFTDLYDIYEFSPGLIDLHEIYDDEGQEVEP